MAAPTFFRALIGYRRAGLAPALQLLSYISAALAVENPPTFPQVFRRIYTTIIAMAMIISTFISLFLSLSIST